MIIMFLFHWVIYLNPEWIDSTEDFSRSMLSIASFMMWLKVLYFCRIFSSTGYLVRMIIEMFYEMRIFIFVLLVTICAYSDAFQTISSSPYQAKDENGEYIRPFGNNFLDAFIITYRMGLGDWNASSEDFGPVATGTVWFLFIINTLFIMIVMMNLLIALISESFARIAENAENASYQEFAMMVNENSYLIPEDVRNNYCDKESYLIISRSIAEEVENIDDKEQVAVLLLDGQQAVVKHQRICAVDLLLRRSLVLDPADAEPGGRVVGREPFGRVQADGPECCPGLERA